MARLRSMTVSAAVAAVVLLFALGIPLFNKAVNPSRDISGQLFELGSVSFIAPHGALLRPGQFRPEAGQIELTVGTADVVISTAGPYDYSADYLASQLERLMEARPSVRMTEERACVAANGLAGEGSNFVTENGTGFVCAFVADRVRSEVTVSAVTLDNQTAQRIDQLLSTLTVKGGL
ncbi:hypothetical protein [Salininema proteolyticum]|uniref:Uncharacterized protein n=1 Tax=Salininema proteolyticum TaxID=1607685 RepID=A0ABV8TTD6_9ACTN